MAVDDVATPYETLRKICLDPPSKKEKEKKTELLGRFSFPGGC